MERQLEVVKVAIVRADGGVSIMSFIVRGRGSVLPEGKQVDWEMNENGHPIGWWLRVASDENIAIEVAKAVPGALRWHRVVDEQIPQDRTFRDALHHDGKNLTHNMDRAREVVLRVVRHERARKLETLDRDWMRATGMGDHKEASQIETERQRLRDLPQTLTTKMTTAKHVDELKPFLTV